MTGYDKLKTRYASNNKSQAGNSKSINRPGRRNLLTWILAGKFLFLSILVHLLFIAAAVFWVVHTYYAKPKTEFKGGEKTADQRARAVEYKVSLAKKNTISNTPTQARRITTTSLSKVSIPEMPVMPSIGENTPVASMGGPGTAGFGKMKAVGGGVGGGPGFTMFGFNKPSPGTLEGTYYSVNQQSNGKPIPQTDAEYFQLVADFIKSDWSKEMLNKYFKGPAKLYATQIFFPDIDSSEAPKAYGIKNPGARPHWLAQYVGRVSPPESGDYHFVGGGDAILIVRFNGKVVLEWCWGDNAGQTRFGWKPEAIYKYGYNSAFPRVMPGGYAKGDLLTLTAGQFYDMEVLIGDQGGLASASLWIEKVGVKYEKDPRGCPILPIFRLSNAQVPNPTKPGEYPPFLQDGPVWNAKAPAPVSGLDALRKQE